MSTGISGTTAFLTTTPKVRSYQYHHPHSIDVLHSRDSTSTTKTTTTTSLFSFVGPSYCEKCGQPKIHRKPPGDERDRSCCSDPTCDFVSYQNPKIVLRTMKHDLARRNELTIRRIIEDLPTTPYTTMDKCPERTYDTSELSDYSTRTEFTVAGDITLLGNYGGY